MQLFASRISTRILLILVLLLTLISLFLRTLNLPNSLQFLGDQGRDALIVADIFRELDPVFIGPVTSIGNMYLGPAYYYFMLPFLLISYPSPLGPAYAVAALGALTVFLTFYLGRQMIGTRGALIAAVLLAFNAEAINLARFSWNPNPAPFVSLLLMWAVWKAWKGSLRYWLLAAVLVSLLLQLHYVAALGGVAAACVWIAQVVRARASRIQLLALGKTAALAIMIVVISFTPLVLFDLKNGGINAAGLRSLVGENESFGSGSVLDRVEKTYVDFEGRGAQLLVTLPFPNVQGGTVTGLFWLIFLLTTVLAGKQLYKKETSSDATWLIAVYLGIGLLGLSLYRHSVFTHYIAFLFPAVFLLYGKLLSLLTRRSFGWIAVAVMLWWYGSMQFSQYYFLPTGTTLSQLSERAVLIQNSLEPGEKFLLVLLASHRDLYGMNYRYYLSIDPDKRPLSPERYQEAETLVIINEEGLSNPVELPIYEIQVFGVTTPDEVLVTPEGVEILLLRKHGNSDDGRV